MSSKGHSRNAPRPALGHSYGAEFFDCLEVEVRSSAEVVVPIVIELLHPSSVLDVGCGRGTWLDVFLRHGVTDVMGVDGPYIPVTELEIPPDAFVGHDLRRPLELGRRFDLVVSVEVAEHLDPDFASTFVSSLVAHASAVLFSAAIPFQGGAGHVNEQWPSYWADLFAVHGFVPVDVVRPVVWSDEQVAFWYAQNTILYVDKTHGSVDELRDRALHAGRPLDLVHPALHTRDHTKPRRLPTPPSLSRVIRDLPGAAWRAARNRTIERPNSRP
jgi:SAM-dependent methyltransferase